MESRLDVPLAAVRRPLDHGCATWFWHDAAATHRYLRDREVDVGQPLQWDGVARMFAFRDPDGNGLAPLIKMRRHVSCCGLKARL
jgi:hypothetical protein